MEDKDKMKELEEKMRQDKDWQEILDDGKKAGYDFAGVLGIAKEMMRLDSFTKMLEHLFNEHKKHIMERVCEISEQCGITDEQAEAKFAEIIIDAVIEYAASVAASFGANHGLREDFLTDVAMPRFIGKLKGIDDDNNIKIKTHRFVNGKPSGGVNDAEN